MNELSFQSRLAGQSNDQSLMGRVFDSYQNLMQIAGCLHELARQLNLSNIRILELSRRETGLADYVTEGTIIRFPTHIDEQPNIGVAFRLPYEDKSFDSCIVTDVYEHIPAEERPQLLKEMLRVTDGLVLIGAPQGNEIVNRFDRIVFDFIWGKYAENFGPLEQHYEFGLDSIERTHELLKEAGASRVVALPCNYVYRWIHQILIFFDLQYKSPDWDLFQSVNKIYNEKISPYDYREPCYRYLSVIPTREDINIDELVKRLSTEKEMPEQVANTEGVLLKVYQQLDTKLKNRLYEKNEEIERLFNMVKQLQHNNAIANNEIQNLLSIVHSQQNTINSQQGTIYIQHNTFIKKLKRKIFHYIKSLINLSIAKFSRS